MRVIRSCDAIPSALKGSVVTLGNFDGIHLGHQSILKDVVAEARQQSKKSCLITFYPHPIKILRPAVVIKYITSFSQKVRIIEDIGIDFVYAIHFNSALSELTAEEFIECYLIRNLNVSHIMVGYDFCFGKNRAGNASLIKEYSRTHAFGFTQISALEYRDLAISSTRIRYSISSGLLGDLPSILGRQYTVEAKVRSGEKRGRKIGFPTANLALKQYVAPPYGVYAIRAHTGTMKNLLGVANYGVRPTVGAKAPLLEVHLFDFNKDIYNQRLSVELLHFIRPEKKFESLDQLKQQIEQDISATKSYFLNSNL